MIRAKDHWIGRARAMYATAARMAALIKDDRLPIGVRLRANKRCEDAVRLAGDFEELALRDAGVPEAKT